MREHVGTAARRVSAEARISAEWKLQHPLWDHRKNHGGERRKLVEIMDDDEHIEALAWGDYGQKGAKDELYGGADHRPHLDGWPRSGGLIIG